MADRDNPQWNREGIENDNSTCLEAKELHGWAIYFLFCFLHSFNYILWNRNRRNCNFLFALAEPELECIPVPDLIPEPDLDPDPT